MVSAGQTLLSSSQSSSSSSSSRSSHCHHIIIILIIIPLSLLSLFQSPSTKLDLDNMIAAPLRNNVAKLLKRKKKVFFSEIAMALILTISSSSLWSSLSSSSSSPDQSLGQDWALCVQAACAGLLSRSTVVERRRPRGADLQCRTCQARN